jgi:hypothetical protein
LLGTSDGGKLPLLAGKGDVIELAAASVGALSHLFFLVIRKFGVRRAPVWWTCSSRRRNQPGVE